MQADSTGWCGMSMDDVELEEVSPELRYYGAYKRYMQRKYGKGPWAQVDQADRWPVWVEARMATQAQDEEGAVPADGSAGAA